MCPLWDKNVLVAIGHQLIAQENPLPIHPPISTIIGTNDQFNFPESYQVTMSSAIKNTVYKVTIT
jgi:hypothetical protein